LFQFKVNANFNHHEASNEDDFYTAAVVEFPLPTSPSIAVAKPAGMIESTLNEFLNLINEATESRADIIVFPEGALNYIGIATRSALIEHAVELSDADIYNSTSFHNNCDYTSSSSSKSMVRIVEAQQVE